MDDFIRVAAKHPLILLAVAVILVLLLMKFNQLR